jgi:hypothetical protein
MFVAVFEASVEAQKHDANQITPSPNGAKGTWSTLQGFAIRPPCSDSHDARSDCRGAAVGERVEAEVRPPRRKPEIEFLELARRFGRSLISVTDGRSRRRPVVGNRLGASGTCHISGSSRRRNR